MKKLIRKLTRWAWADFLYDVNRVEYKYGRNDNGAPKDWTEWENVREHLKEHVALRKPEELEGRFSTVVFYRRVNFMFYSQASAKIVDLLNSKVPINKQLWEEFNVINNSYNNLPYFEPYILPGCGKESRRFPATSGTWF